MALPTTQKEVTTRRIASLISGLWDKVKNAFLRKNATSQSTGTLPLLVYDNGTAKYNSDITIDFSTKNMLAGNSTPNSATPTSPYSNNLSIRNINSNASYIPSFHKPPKDMFVLLKNVSQSTITIVYGTASRTSNKLLDAGHMMLISYSVQDEGWSYVGEIVSAPGTYDGLISDGSKYIARKVIGFTAIDLNDLTFKNDESKIEVVEWWPANKDKVANKPIDSSGTVMMFGYDNINYVQIANMKASDELYFRAKTYGSIWTSWESISKPTLKPISNYNGYKELDFTGVTFETFRSNATVENSFSNKLFGASFDSTNRCIRCLVRLHLSNNIINNLKVGEYPIAVVYMTRQVGSLMIFSNDPNTYAVRMYISPTGSLGDAHRFSPPSAVGSSSQPVFVNSDGSFSPCTSVIANSLPRSFINKESQTTKIWKKVATSKVFTSYDKSSITFLICGDGYNFTLGLESIVTISIRTGYGGTLSEAYVGKYSFKNSCSVELLRIGSTNQYEIWVKDSLSDTGAQLVYLNSQGVWTIDSSNDQSNQKTDSEYSTYKSSNPSVASSYYHTYNIAKAPTSQTGGPSTPVYVNSNGEIVACTGGSLINYEVTSAVPSSPTAGKFYFIS